ncbi:MAG: hypothetical protein GY749_49180 [Desulfobacteraceae bacterium]|nr:hypothetical protein [Desulfobacteraceae bacterium]
MRVCADETVEDNPAGICSPAGFNGLTQTVYVDLHGSAKDKRSDLLPSDIMKSGKRKSASLVFRTSGCSGWVFIQLKT